jgi:DNA end-binding protein Ku
MAARPIWKGQLRLSLVAIPVELYSATKTTAKVSFRQIHEPSGKPVRYQKVVPGVGPVESDQILKGFEYEKGHYVLLTDEEIEDVRLETKKTLELTQFVGACDIDPLYFGKPYYLAPADELAEDAFRVVRDALRETEKVGLGQLALRGREYLVAVKPCGTGLLLETLHYEDEIRKTDAFFSSISGEAADPDLVAVAKELIERKSAPFDAAAFKDHYTSALREVIARKLKGRKPPTMEEERAPPAGAEIIDLMSALKASLERTEDGGKARGRGRAAAKAPAGGRAAGGGGRKQAQPKQARQRKSA